MITHPPVEEIDAFIDDELARDAAHAVAAHVRTCAQCAEVVAARRRLADAAAALAIHIEPPIHLWGEIEGRLRQVGSRREPAPKRSWLTQWRAQWSARVLLAASGVLLVITGGLLLKGVARPPTVGVAQEWEPALQPWDVMPASTNASDIAHFRLQIATILDEESHSLSPQTMATLRQNLVVIDSAIAQIETALARDPASPRLRERLLRAYRAQSALVRLTWQAS